METGVTKIKIHWNSVISEYRSIYMCMDVNYFYLDKDSMAGTRFQSSFFPYFLTRKISVPTLDR